MIHGHYDAELAAAGGGPRAPLRRRVLLALTGLARHEEQMPEHVPQPELGTERSRRRSEWVQEQLQTPADAGDEAPVPPPASAGPEAE